MQPDALNLAIAQSIEQKPDYRPVITGSISGLQTFTDRPGITDAWMYEFATGVWRPRNFISDPANSFLLLKKMKEEGIQFVIYSEPDYGTVENIKVHWELINSNEDYEIRVTWGDSNCSHPKPYDPVDGHGYTSFEVIGKLGDIIAEAWARAKGIYVDDKEPQ